MSFVNIRDSALALLLCLATSAAPATSQLKEYSYVSDGFAIKFPYAPKPHLDSIHPDFKVWTEWKIRSCVPNHLRRSCLLLHRDWALAQRWSATGGTQEPDVEFQFPKDAVQRVAVHAQCLSSPTLIRFLLSQNGKNEDLLEFAYRLGIPGAAPVHVQHQFLELFLHSELPSA